MTIKLFAQGSSHKSCSPASTRYVTGEDGKSSKNKLDVVTYPHHGSSEKSRSVADEQMSIPAFVCIQEGQGMDFARAAACEARKGKPHRAPWAGGHCRHSPAHCHRM